MKHVLPLVWLGTLAALLAGCGGPPVASVNATATPPGGFPISITDDSGRQVTLPAPPQRIVSLAPAHTETLYALGLGGRVVAADTYSDYPPEAKPKATINCWPRPSVESIVALKPDLVLVLTQDTDFLEQMEGAQVPALKLFPETYGRVLDEIALLGRLTGTQERARELVAGMQKQAQAVQARVKGAPRKRVLYELDATDPSRPFVAGSGGFYGALLGMAGGKNVFADVSGPSTQVSAEQILARDPEVILLGDTASPQHPQSPQLVARRAGWSGIEAVKKGQIWAVNSDEITRPGPRLVKGLEAIARRLHPDRFASP